MYQYRQRLPAGMDWHLQYEFMKFYLKIVDNKGTKK